MTYSRIFWTPTAIVLSAVGAGCASNSVGPEQQQAFVRAEAAVTEANESGAYEYASAELESARAKLAAANTAVEEGYEDRASRLATEARLDAELATAITSNQETQAAVQELYATIDTLRRELQQDQ